MGVRLPLESRGWCISAKSTQDDRSSLKTFEPTASLIVIVANGLHVF